MKLFLDANIIFTAAYSPGGISSTLFRLAEAGNCELVTSEYAVDEARRNLTLKAEGKLQDLAVLLRQVRLVREPPPSRVAWAAELPLAYKDAPILAAAVECQAAILVTGDRRDFGHLLGSSFQGVTVLLPTDALDRLLAELA